MVRPGLINLDFADVRSVMDEMGKAMMGTGESEGEDRAVNAAEKAIANPLLDEISLRGAKGVLINITGGGDLTLFELDEAANRIREEVDAEANIIVGSTLDVEMGGAMRVSVVATGIDAVETPEEMPRPRRNTPPPPPSSSADPSDRLHAPDPSQADSPVAQNRPTKRYTAPERARDNERSEYRGRAQDAYDEQRAETRSDLAPEPALAPYRLEEPRFEADENAYNSEPETFVAPRPSEPGTPTPEAMSRLQAAVRNAPNKLQKSMNRVDDAPEEGERRGFGINSLINRMTGQPSVGSDKTVTTRSHPTSQQAETDFEPEPGVDPDQERIEIPAFLRRQAN